jgi:hypothetical protein
VLVLVLVGVMVVLPSTSLRTVTGGGWEAVDSVTTVNTVLVSVLAASSDAMAIEVAISIIVIAVDSHRGTLYCCATCLLSRRASGYDRRPLAVGVRWRFQVCSLE